MGSFWTGRSRCPKMDPLWMVRQSFRINTFPSSSLVLFGWETQQRLYTVGLDGDKAGKCCVSWATLFPSTSAGRPFFSPGYRLHKALPFIFCPLRSKLGLAFSFSFSFFLFPPVVLFI